MQSALFFLTLLLFKCVCASVCVHVHVYKLLTAVCSTTWLQLACPILFCCLGKSSDFISYILGKSSVEIIYIMGNTLVTTKWLKCHYSEILESNDKSVCLVKPVEFQFGRQHKQKFQQYFERSRSGTSHDKKSILIWIHADRVLCA